MNMKTTKAAQPAKVAKAAPTTATLTDNTQQTVTTVTTVTTVGHPTDPAGATMGAGKKRWAYAYQIIPPQREDRLKAVKALIAKEMAEAKKAERTWQGRFIPEAMITHLLVVSDSPDQAGEMNVRLESALTELKTTFVRTTPFVIDEGVELGDHGSSLSPTLAPLIEVSARELKQVK